jgi:hypothetical protein
MSRCILSPDGSGYIIVDDDPDGSGGAPGASEGGPIPPAPVAEGDKVGREAPVRSGGRIEDFFVWMRQKHGYDVTGEHWPDWWKWRKEATS